MFDLGGTLVRYYERSEFPTILEQGIVEVEQFLATHGLLAEGHEVVRARVGAEDYESADNRSRPLEERLARIFRLDQNSISSESVMEMCRRFMRPIFARAYRYDDTLPALQELRVLGFRLGIVSNASWGSPASLWREEIRRWGLDEHISIVVFDRDVGWRKPAKLIFEYELGANPQDCVFVGDEPRWDVEGPRAVGIDPILIDRRKHSIDLGVPTIHSLSQLLSKLTELDSPR
jgi:putative hydrolase of the HAD superfamily